VDRQPRFAARATPFGEHRPDAPRQIPTQQTDYDRWREIWQAMTDNPRMSNQDIADAHDVSARTAQGIRTVGTAGLLDSPQTPVARIAALAPCNAHLVDGGDYSCDIDGDLERSAAAAGTPRSNTLITPSPGTATWCRGPWSPSGGPSSDRSSAWSAAADTPTAYTSTWKRISAPRQQRQRRRSGRLLP
jgi:hypothetical protein